MSSRWDSAPSAAAGPSQSPPTEGNTTSSAAAAAAAAAAAKIAAQYGVAKEEKPANGGPEAKKKDDHESPFSSHVDINDVKNRYLITKGSTQQQIHEETGASLTTKGTWYPDRHLAKPENPPLFIHVEATTQESLDKALAKIQEVIDSEAPQLIEERGMRGRAPSKEEGSGTPDGRPGGSGWPERRKWSEERISMGLETLRNFNVRAKIVGPGGMFVKYIQAETGTRVQIKGRGSGFIESDTGRESEDEMHIHITGPDETQLAEAKRLAEDLLDAVKTEWEKARQMLEQQGFAVPPAGGWPRGSQGPAGGAYGQPGPGGPMGGQGYAQNAGYNGSSHGQAQGAHQTTAQAKSPEEEALDKYWKDYIAWEDSFKAYHNRLPTKEDGGQDVPAQYRRS